MIDEKTTMNTVNDVENIFQKIKDSKKGTFHYDEIFKDLSQEIIKRFPNCQRDVSVHVSENYMNQDLNVHFIINTIPVLITKNEHGMAPSMLSNIMHVLACRIGISINVAYYDKFEFTPLQNPQS